MAAGLYNEHFGLRERPFSLSPDPEFLFMSKAHAKALSVLEYGILTKAPLTVVSGEVGTGKTTLIQALLRRLDDDVTVGLISNARGDRGDLLRWVLGAFDVPAPEGVDYVTLFQRFQDFVIAEYAASKHVVLIVDEAQNLGMDALEELRLLTNINSGKDELLQIVMVGQPELRDMIAQPELRQFAQRVTAAFHLQPMDMKTTLEYVTHRLQHAGGTGQEFTVEAVRFIHEHSDGIPRMVNKLCDLALVYASSADTKQVELAVVQELIDDGVVLKPFQPTVWRSSGLDARGKAAE
jgi:type II secretory pathway predicted ATPase ExeA